LLLESLEKAVAELKQRLGPDMTTWHWGRLHQMTFAPAVARLADPQLRQWLTLPPVELPGSGESPRAASFDAERFSVQAGASVRMVLDVGQWDQSMAINAPGQSDNPASPHYGDLLSPWAAGHYVPLPFSRAAVEAAAEQVLNLVPAPQKTPLDVSISAIDAALAASPRPGMVIGITDRQGLRKVLIHGYADLKTKTPLTADSRFAIGSVSKAFTSIALLQLAEQGRFDPHAPITQYLPWLHIPSRFNPITGHDLMSHTGGLPGYLADAASSRFAGLELRSFEPAYPPGAHWFYSNTGYQLLGYALEEIERSSYSDIIRRRVLEPLGMSHSSAVLDDAQRFGMAVSYVRWPYDGRYVEAP
jgi:hypothetical protein